MRLTVTVYPADRNQFIINAGQVPLVSNLCTSRSPKICASRWCLEDSRPVSRILARREVVQVLLALTITSTVAGIISALAAVWAVLPKRRTPPQTIVIIVERQPFREFSRRALTPPDADRGPSKPN
jgi:hypothetical protein